MELDKEFSVTITVNEMVIELKKLIQSPHSQLISETIIGHISRTSNGLNQLYKAFSGIAPVTKYKVLDEGFVSYEMLGTWRMYKPSMEDAGMIFQGKLKVKIVEIDLMTSNPLKVEYSYIGSTSGPVLTGDYDIQEKYFHLSQDELI